MARWLGPPVGIVRVEHALASYALARRPDIALSFFDARDNVFLELASRWALPLIGWEGAIDTITLDHRRYRSRLRNAMPSRFPIVMALERWRIGSSSPAARRLADGLQRAVLLRPRLPLPFADQAGKRLAVVPFRSAVRGPIVLKAGDVIISAGSDWFHKPAAAIAALKSRLSFRYVVLCYDLIPLLFPQWFKPHDVALFDRYWREMFALADRVVVNSRHVALDIRRFCESAGLLVPSLSVVPPGFDPPPPPGATQLPAGLRPRSYALFVSTIEPRKGHGMLLDAWRRLLDLGVVQRNGFALVFVGRPGWMVEEVLHRLKREDFAGTVHQFAELSDSALAALYRGAAFCLYPSRYEGFGLPVIEAFAHGKAVLASTGGAVPETVNGLSPCLDAEDTGAWVAAIRAWIEEPEARAPWEGLIRARFAQPSWEQAAEHFFTAALGKDEEAVANRAAATKAAAAR